MSLAKLDERGRITLGKEIVKEYGRDFFIVKAPKEIVLLPLPKDPIKVLQQEGKKLPKGISIERLRKKIIEQAFDDLK